MISPSGAYERWGRPVIVRRAAPRIIISSEEMEALKAANKPLRYMTLEEMDATYTGSRWRPVYLSVAGLQ